MEKIVDKEYTIKLTVEFEGMGIGESRDEAIELLDIPDFIDEATHSRNFIIKEIKPKLNFFEKISNVYKGENNASDNSDNN